MKLWQAYKVWNKSYLYVFQIYQKLRNWRFRDTQIIHLTQGRNIDRACTIFNNILFKIINHSNNFVYLSRHKFRGGWDIWYGLGVSTLCTKVVGHKKLYNRLKSKGWKRTIIFRQLAMAIFLGCPRQWHPT